MSLDSLHTDRAELRERCFADLARLPDEQLMLHVKSGHDDALAVLFDRYHRLVLSVGYKILRDLGEAEDLMQAVFLEFYRTAAQFDPVRGSAKTWLLQYAYHRSMNRRKYLRRRNFYGQGEMEEAIQLPDTDGPSVAGVFSTVEARKILSGAIQGLNAAQRKTIQMAYFEGMTLREIAETTGEPMGNVRHHYYRGLRRLRELVTEGRAPGKEKLVRRGIVDAKA
jgi:RNA polymerase sigma-70 factor (ECF subfamily)